MKRKICKGIFAVIVCLLMLAVVALYLYEVFWMKKPYTYNLLRTITVVLLLFVTLVKLVNDSGRKNLAVYENVYADVLGNAFSTKPLLRKKLLCACRLYDESNYRKSLKYLYQLLGETELKTDAIPVLLFVALCYTDAGYPNEAIKAYYDLLKIDSNNPRVHSNLGMLFVEIGDFDTALEHYNESIEIKPDNYVAYINRANYYFRINEFDNAIADAKQALGYKNNCVEAAGLLTIIYAILGDEENKKHYYHIAITSGKNPQDLNDAIEYYLSVQNIPSGAEE